MIGRLNPAAWPLTLKVPLLVAALMVSISVAISQLVLSRLAQDQETHLRNLTNAYLEGLETALRPHVLRHDVWETFDVLDRARTGYDAVQARFTIVTLPGNRVLAASDPIAFRSFEPVPSDLLAKFDAPSINVDEDAGRAWVSRPLREEETRIGTILAEIDITDLLAVRHEVLLTLIIANGILTAFLAATGYLLVRRMIAPIELLGAYAERVRDGAAEPIPAGQLKRHGRTEFGRLFRRFNEMADAVREREALAARLAAEEKVAMLGKMASGLAHEVNNPLGGILNAVDTLKTHGNDPSIRRTSIEFLERGLLGIRNLVRAILVTYKGVGLTGSLSRGDLDDLALLVHHEVERRRLTLDWRNDLPARVAVDGSATRQVLLNLLLNACAAAPVGSVVAIHAEVRHGDLIVRVTDRGPGLPPEISRMLLRNDGAAAPPPDGHGLGVWTIVRLVERLKGRISVEAPEDGGTTVVLSLPLVQEEELDAVA